MQHLRVSLVFGFMSCAVLGALLNLGILPPIHVAPGTAKAVPVILQAGLIAVLAYGMAWCSVDISSGTAKSFLLVGTVAEVLWAVWVCKAKGYYLAPWPPVLAIFLSAGVGDLYSRSGAGARRKKALALFGNRISRQQLNRIVDSDLPLDFHGELREATVLVCEIFPDLSLERIPAPEQAAMSNCFMSQAADFLREHGAYLEDYTGRSIRAVFGGLQEEPGHAAQACTAAVDLLRRMDEANEDCDQKWHHTFDFRVALNSGEMVMATCGENATWGLRFTGEPVEFARRLCLANNVFGTRLLVGGETHALAAPFIEVRPIEMIRGRHERSREEVYELLAKRHELSEEEQERRDLFWKGIVCYRQQAYEEALSLLFAALPEGAQDPAAMFYIRRIEHLCRGGQVHELENAPL